MQSEKLVPHEYADRNCIGGPGEIFKSAKTAGNFLPAVTLCDRCARCAGTFFRITITCPHYQKLMHAATGGFPGSSLSKNNSVQGVIAQGCSSQEL